MNDLQKKFIDNEIAKRKAQEQALPLRKRINKATGKIKVFLLHEQAYKEVFPVDAREMVENGHATLEPVELVGKAGRIKIAPDQLEDYLKKGYKILDVELPEEEPQGDASIDLNDLKVDELKEKAKAARIPGYANMNKTALIEALSKPKEDGENGDTETATQE